jgi:hypothetical protein
MPRPDFLIIGAQKSGTSWLAHNLARHPTIFLPDSEIHFFDKADLFAKGPAWYESHFEDASPGHLVGEKTPDYLWTTSDGAERHHAGSHERIHDLYPEAKLIVTLRNPVERAISALNHLIRTGRVSPFHHADDLLVGHKHALVANHGVLEKGLYFRQLKAYLDRFDRRQLLVLLFEDDIVQQPRAALRRLFEFLEVDPSLDLSSTQLHQKVNAHRRSTVSLALQYYLGAPRHWMQGLDRFVPTTRWTPSPDVVRRLHDLYAKENEKLFTFLDRPLPPSWTAPE